MRKTTLNGTGKSTGKNTGRTVEITAHIKCVVVTDKCEKLEPKVHNIFGFDTYEVEVGKYYWVGCENITYKIYVHGKGRENTFEPKFDIVEVSLMPLNYYCKEVVVNE